MLSVDVTQMYNKKEVYLRNAILVTKLFCYRYSAIDNSAKNNIFQQNLVIALEIYWELSVRNFI